MESIHILWVDDDPQDRFKYEIELIKKEFKYKLEWTETIQEAAQKLNDTPYSALILDQMLPPKHGDRPDIWGGCTLLYWLRGKETAPWGDKPRPETHLDPSEVKTDLWSSINNIGEPNIKNSNIKTVIVSAFHDDDVHEKLSEASTQDKKISFIDKPIDSDEFTFFLKELSREKKY